MNQPSQTLFKLIKTLTTNEKSQFVKQLSLNSRKDPKLQVVKLFKYLVKQKNYNQAQAIADLKSEIPPKSFVVVKNHLKVKLKYFLSVTQFTSLRSQIHLQFLEIEMLFNRQLFHEAEATCNSLIELAKKAEITQVIIEANSWKFILLPYTTKSNYDIKFQEILADYNSGLKDLEIGGRIREFQETIIAKGMQNFDLHNVVEIKKAEDWLFQITKSIGSNVEILSNGNRIMYEIIRMIVLRALGKYEESLQAAQVMLDIVMNNYDFYISNKRNDFIAIMTNYLAAVSVTKHFDKFEAHLKLVKGLLSKKFKGNVKLEGSYVLSKFLFELYTKGKLIRGEIFEAFEQYYLSISQEDYTSVLDITYCLGTYAIGAYEKGMNAMQAKINAYRKSNVREELLVDFQIFYFISYFLSIISKRWSNKQLFEFSVRLEPIYNIYRKKPKNHDYAFELCLISFFRKLKPTVTRKEMLKHTLVTEKKFADIFSVLTPATANISVDFNYIEFIHRCKTYLSR